MIIYKIENNLTHNVYIGKTNNFERRMREHQSNALNSNSDDYDKLLSKKIREYGWENFSKNIIEECNDNEWQERESYWISYYNSFHGDGYNQTSGGDGVPQDNAMKEYFNEIVDLLKNSALTQHEIALKYNTVDSVISNINQGLILYNKDIKYPIRINNIKSKHDTIYYLLENTTKTFKEISEELKVAESTVKKMNYGTLNHDVNRTYPIRKLSSIKQKALTIQELLLLNFSNKEIKAIVDTSDRTIGRINSGETHYNPELNYPLRNSQPCND